MNLLTRRQKKVEKRVDASVGPRVRNGVRLLDEREPGWRKRIDTEKLDISTTDNCILGQLYGSYGEGLNRLKLSRGDHWYGFCGPYHAQLTEEWKLAISA